MLIEGILEARLHDPWLSHLLEDLVINVLDALNLLGKLLYLRKWLLRYFYLFFAIVEGTAFTHLSFVLRGY